MATHESAGNQSAPPTAPPRAAPITTPQAFLSLPPAAPSSHQSAWPRVFSILSIILGSISALIASIKSLVMALMALSPAPLGFIYMQGFTRLIDPLAAWSCLLNIIWLALSILLIIAGAKLRKRKPSSITLHQAWIMFCLPTVIAIEIMQAFTRRYFNLPSNTLPPTANTLLSDLLSPAVLATIAILSAYPIFLLIWLNRPAIKREYQTWNHPGTAPPITMASPQAPKQEPVL